MCLGIIAGTVRPKNWCGSFNGNAWTNDWVPIPKLLARFDEHPEGTLLKGHCGWLPEIESKLRDGGQAVMFLYRDLRDVAVSQAFHVLNENDKKWIHPGKDLFRDLTSFEDVLAAVITGVGEYPGLIERWELYAPWLDVDWVFKTSFEMLRRYPERVSHLFTAYVMHRTASHHGMDVILDSGDLARIAAQMKTAMKRTDTPTFRKGAIGDWREHFTPHVTATFKEAAGHWLQILGYENGTGWGK